MNPTKDNVLESKEKELNIQFDLEKKEAETIEEQIKVLQARHQVKMANIMRLQGAFALLQDLKKPKESNKDELTKPEEERY